MTLTTDILDSLFEFQLNRPLSINEGNIEDMALMFKVAKSRIEVSDGDEVYKYFIEKNGKYKLYYVNGFHTLTNILFDVAEKTSKVYVNGGIPIFVEG